MFMTIHKLFVNLSRPNFHLFKPPKACASSHGEPALKARRSTAQGGGCEASRNPGLDCKSNQALIGAAQASASPLSGLSLYPIPIPGFQSPHSRALPPWALLPRAFGALELN